MNKKILIPIIAIAVLLIGALAFLGIRLSQANKANEEMVQLFELEKEEMENEYSSFATQYDEMQILISNDSLVAQLEREKLRTQQLLEELRATKASNAAEITRLKKELKTVRAVMRSYVVHLIKSLLEGVLSLLTLLGTADYGALLPVIIRVGGPFFTKGVLMLGGTC